MSPSALKVLDWTLTILLAIALGVALALALR
jgi:hypothetical protein